MTGSRSLDSILSWYRRFLYFASLCSEIVVVGFAKYGLNFRDSAHFSYMLATCGFDEFRGCIPDGARPLVVRRVLSVRS